MRGASRRAAGWAVHLLTATGLVFAALAAMELVAAPPRPNVAFAWLLAAVVIDALDGPLARALRIREVLPEVDGRKIDDIIDFLTFSFIPLLLVWRMGWLVAPAWLWVAPALIASILVFAHDRAKEMQGGVGFFVRFPSYWNILAFYAGLWHHHWGPRPGTVLFVIAVVCTILPLRFVHPTLTPRRWRVVLLGSGAAWALGLAAMLPLYPLKVPPWAMWLSLCYPVLYLIAGAVLHRRARCSGEPARAI